MYQNLSDISFTLHSLYTSIPVFLGSLLSLRELVQRDSQLHTHPFTVKVVNNHLMSYAFAMFQKYFSDLTGRLKVDIAVIDFNLLRLESFILTHMQNFHVKNKKDKILQRNPERNECLLSYNEMALALEFYLQIDGKFIIYLYIWKKIFCSSVVHFSQFILHENMLLSWCTASF